MKLDIDILISAVIALVIIIITSAISGWIVGSVLVYILRHIPN